MIIKYTATITLDTIGDAPQTESEIDKFQTMLEEVMENGIEETGYTETVEVIIKSAL